MMKKWMMITLSLLLAVSAVGCGENQDKNNKPPDYQPLIREDLMWDTEQFFSRSVTMTEGEGTFENKYGETRAIFFDGEPYQGRKTTVFAYYGVPSAPMPEGGYPAVVLVHGGGGCAFYEWVEYWNGKGYAAIAPDFYGQQYGSYSLQNGHAPKNPDGGPSDSGSFGSTAETCKDSWVYHSVANIMLAHNILRADERVADDRIGLTGISWGSVLTLIASGVDYRFGAFAPVYGSGFLLQTPGVEGKSYFTPPADPAEWMQYYDPVSYLPYNNRPTLFSIGTNDSFFSPLLQQNSSELCQGAVYYGYRWELRHYHRWKDEEGMLFIASFFDRVLCGKEQPFFVAGEALNGRTLTVKLEGAENVRQIRLCYTDAVGETSLQWKWNYLALDPADLKGGTLTAEIPSSAVLAFAEFSDMAFSEFFASSALYRLA